MSKQVVDAMVDGAGAHHQHRRSTAARAQAGQTNYSAAKAGMHGFTKALALEVAKKGVTVNTISPGYIGTKMVTAIPKDVLDSKILPHIPVGRLGKPEEVAGLIIYLASDEAAFVTGANIAINGGQHMKVTRARRPTNTHGDDAMSKIGLTMRPWWSSSLQASTRQGEALRQAVQQATRRPAGARADAQRACAMR